MTKGLPPPRKQNISQKAQEKDDKIKKKLYTADRNWNYWRLQLHWNKLEWVNTRSKIKRKTLFIFFKKYYINKDIRTAHWVDH